MSKILYLTDYPVGATSGYATIAKPICNQLVEDGHEVKLVGLSNRGEEHWESFGIIAVDSFGEAEAAIHNLSMLWKPDVVILSLDIPVVQRMIDKIVKPNIKYLMITPLENGPLCHDWALSLSQFDKVLFISQLGEDEARKVGLRNVGHLSVGVDSDLWRPASGEEREIARRNLGFEPDEKIVFTVADNQERKNLAGGMTIIKKMKINNPDMKVKYVLVTREHSPYGWKLQELAQSFGIKNDIVIFDRGMTQEQLRLLYICADAFLLPSKAEGLGLPVLEAMSCGIPCVCTATGALNELLKDGRGWLVEPEYTVDADVWGNSRRDFISTDLGAIMLKEAIEAPNNLPIITEYAKSRTWMAATKQVEDCIKEITHG